MYEMWKRQQIHENERKVHRAEEPVIFLKMGKATFGR